MPVFLSITGVDPQQLPASPALFEQSLLRKRWPSWTALATSTVSHALFFGFSYLLAPLFAAPPPRPENDRPLRASRVVKIQLVFPDRLPVIPAPRFVVQRENPPQDHYEAHEPKLRESTATASQLMAPSGIPDAVQTAIAEARAQTRMPALPNAPTMPMVNRGVATATTTQQTVLRPDIPVTLDTNVRLPSFLVWNERQPIPKPLSSIGVSKPAIVPTPNESAPTTTQSAATFPLVVPTVPRQFVPDTPQPAAANAQAQQQHAQVLSIANSFMPMPRVLDIPAVNQIGAGAQELPSSGGGSSSGANNRNLSSGKSQGTSGTGTAGTTVLGSVAQSHGASDASNSALLSMSVRPPRSAEAGSAAGSGTNGSSTNPGGTATATPSVNANHPINTNHPPIPGSFDVVIVQSSADKGIPEIGSFLHGKPVYTVYLELQDAKEWILEYCVPDDRPADDGSSGVVVLSAPARVDAPFPLKTVHPEGQLMTKLRYLLLHGVINTEGLPVNFEAADTDDPDYAKAAIAALHFWKFTPAKRDGVPVPVEAVLAIPSPWQ